MNSKNIILTGKQKIQFVEEPLAEPGPDEVLAHTRLSLISTGTECHCYRGEFEPGTHWAGWVQYPFYPGYSNVAQVEATGDEVEGLKKGDRIFSRTGHVQRFCAASDPVKIPDEVSDEDAAWSKLATISQTGVRRAGIRMGARAVVIGLGPLGQLIAQYLRVMGAEEILVVDTVKSRLDAALLHGATNAFEGPADDAVSFVEEFTDGVLADVVFDATGHPAVFPTALPLARQFGTVMLIGDTTHPSKQQLSKDVLTRQLTVLGSHNENLSGPDAEWIFERQVRLFYKYIERKQMRLGDLITHRHSPAHAPCVYSKLLEDRSETIGVAFDWRNVD